MDSNVYIEISNKIIDLYPYKIKELPLSLAVPVLKYSEKCIADIQYFIKTAEKFLIQKSTSISPLFKELILNNHKTIFNKNPSETDKLNNIEFVNYITNSINNNKENYIEGAFWQFSLLCFILESSVHYGFCKNRFEQHIKSASHKSALCLLKNIYNINAEESLFIVGYLRSAWCFAQKTEGIKDLDIKISDSNKDFKFKFTIKKENFEIKQTNKYLFLID